MKNFAKILLLVPSIIFPYVILFLLACIFFSPSVPFFAYIVEHVFANFIGTIVFFIVAYGSIAFTLLAVFTVLSLVLKWDALFVSKTAMIIKFIHLPAHLAIFVLGCMFLITLFTLPFTVALSVVSFVCRIMTATVSIISVINAKRTQALGFKPTVWMIALQFIFCADAIVSVIIYKRLKSLYSSPVSPTSETINDDE